MVNRKGQALTESVVMLAFMTLIGIAIMKYMIGARGKGGSVNAMSKSEVQHIAEDEHP